MTKRPRVGLEAIAFDVPKHYLELDLLARERGVNPSKYRTGLGQLQMAVPTPCEDTVSLAVGAGLELLRNFDVDPRTIGMVIVGTETGVDHSKPVAVYVHELLGLPKGCRVFDTKHACYGATAGVSMAMSWVLSGRNRDKKALVIASDLANYGLTTAGEPTQGAGAVAMLVGDEPRLLELDGRFEACHASEAMDFWRPNYLKEGIVDGKFSIDCYLDALEACFATHRRQAIELGDATEDQRYLDRFSACLYHGPFTKMAQKAHFLLSQQGMSEPIIPKTPAGDAALADFDERVAPFLELNARVGNIYTGSLYLQLINALEDGVRRAERPLISLFSYGSGSGAELLSGWVAPDASALMKRAPFRATLDRRASARFERYEEIYRACAESDRNDSTVCDPSRWDVAEREVLYLGTKAHVRQYAFNRRS